MLRRHMCKAVAKTVPIDRKTVSVRVCPLKRTCGQTDWFEVIRSLLTGCPLAARCAKCVALGPTPTFNAAKVDTGFVRCFRA